jgi:hypothetical protein
MRGGWSIRAGSTKSAKSRQSYKGSFRPFFAGQTRLTPNKALVEKAARRTGDDGREAAKGRGMATSVAMHPAAPAHLPGFITAPGETDPLFVGSVIFLIIVVMGLGSLYFWLHSIPERLAHGTGKIQFQLVGVLALLALFTHNNLFWVFALMLALIPIPDFWTPLASMADSLTRMVRPRRPPPDQAVDPAIQPMLPLEHGGTHDAPHGEAAAEGHKP